MPISTPPVSAAGGITLGGRIWRIWPDLHKGGVVLDPGADEATAGGIGHDDREGGRAWPSAS